MIPKSKILIVDDDDELRISIGETLEEVGYEVLYARNGREALQLLVNCDVAPTLILLDLRMPVMDGWEFARVVRYYNRFRDIPIVVVATPTVGTWRPVVDDVLWKPFSIDALLGAVEKYLPLAETPQTP